MNEAYLMDCMEYMKTLPDNAFDLAVVDPPYGGNDAIGLTNNLNYKKQLAKRSNYKVFKNEQPNKEYFQELKRVSKNQIVWGVNFYNVDGLTGGRIVWDKHGTAFGRAEIAYYSGSKSVEIFDYTWNGMLQGNMKDKEVRIHPTQKPVALYRWIFKNYAKPGMKILDTHLGSGSSRIAAWDAGLDFVGTEIDETYFRLQEERFKKHIAQGNLFLPQEKVAEQIDLFNVALNEEKPCYSTNVDT
jgi:site-specific DNA-methyltransferase (adenine-specific)